LEEGIDCCTAQGTFRGSEMSYVMTTESVM
jgi:hypothetical protein